jgi:hypothetical protein
LIIDLPFGREVCQDFLITEAPHCRTVFVFKTPALKCPNWQKLSVNVPLQKKVEVFFSFNYSDFGFSLHILLDTLRQYSHGLRKTEPV